LRDAPSSAETAASTGSGRTRDATRRDSGRGAVTPPREPRRNHEPESQRTFEPTRRTKARDPRRGAASRERSGGSSRERLWGAGSGLTRGATFGRARGRSTREAEPVTSRPRRARGRRPWRGGSPRGDRPAAVLNGGAAANGLSRGARPWRRTSGLTGGAALRRRAGSRSRERRVAGSGRSFGTGRVGWPGADDPRS